MLKLLIRVAFITLNGKYENSEQSPHNAVLFQLTLMRSYLNSIGLFIKSFS